MKNATAALQAAMVSRLKADPELNFLLGGPRIYDRVPQGAPPPYVTLAGIETHDWSIDATNQDSADRWRELLANAGVKSAAIRGAGICRDQACDETIRALFFAGAIRDWQVVIPALGRVTGAFQITALEFGGVHDGELTFELALMSAGPLSFARA